MIPENGFYSTYYLTSLINAIQEEVSKELKCQRLSKLKGWEREREKERERKVAKEIARQINAKRDRQTDREKDIGIEREREK